MSTSFLPVVTALNISIGQCHAGEGESHAGEGKGFTGSCEERWVEMEGELSYTGETSSLG